MVKLMEGIIQFFLDDGRRLRARKICVVSDRAYMEQRGTRPIGKQSITSRNYYDVKGNMENIIVQEEESDTGTRDPIFSLVWRRELIRAQKCNDRKGDQIWGGNPKHNFDERGRCDGIRQLLPGELGLWHMATSLVNN
jgi:hypothetical protein